MNWNLQLLRILKILCFSREVLSYTDDIPTINSTFLQNILEDLIEPQFPIVLILDDEETSLEPYIRDIFINLENAGWVVYLFRPELKGSKLKAGTNGATDTVSFRWTFISLIEEKKSKQNAASYLKTLLDIGHGRNDQFLLIGHSTNLSPFIRVPVPRFKNIIAMAFDKLEDGVYQRTTGSKKLVKLTSKEAQNLQWLEIETMVGLSGDHFRISGIKFPPYLDIFYDTDDDDNSSTDGKTLMGVNYQIFYQGSIAYNYTFEFNPPSDWKELGQLLPNGSWDGVFADVIQGKADIAAVQTQTPKRNLVADFVGPFGRAHLTFATAFPKNFIGKYAIFRSYTNKVWLIIFIYFLVMVILMCQALKNAILIENGQQRRERTDFLKILSSAWFISWGISFEQTIERQPMGLKVVMMLWVYFILVIGTGYRSNLAAKMSFPLAEYRPKNFHQLAKTPEYKIYMDQNFDAQDYFKESTNADFHNIYNRIIITDNMTQCVTSALVEPKSVCIGWQFTLRVEMAKTLTMEQMKYPLYVCKEPAFSTWYTFSLWKNSRFTHAFQKIGQHFFEAGLNHLYRVRLVRTYRSMGINHSKRNTDSKEYQKLLELKNEWGQSDKKPFKVSNFQLIFYLWMFGLIASVGTFLWEVFGKRGRSMHRSLSLRRFSILSFSKAQNQIFQVKPDAGSSDFGR